MASPAAERYFASFPPGQQEQIVNSWSGQDLKEQWFQNAVAAGAVSPEGIRPELQGATEDSASAGGMTPALLREKAKTEGWSEDFARFDDATLRGWIADYWDPAKGKFRSMHAPEGAGDWAYAEKPTDSVTDPTSGHEYGPWGQQVGVDLTAKGSTGGGVATPAAASPAAPTESNPLQDALMRLFTDQAGYFGEHPVAMGLDTGGVIWQDRPATTTVQSTTPGATTVTTPTVSGGDPSAKQPVNPALVSATLNAFTPAAPSLKFSTSPNLTMPTGASTGYTRQATPITPLSMTAPPVPTSPTSTTLTQALAQKFKKPNQWWMPQA